MKLFDPFWQVKAKYPIPGIITVDDVRHLFSVPTVKGAAIRLCSCTPDDRDIFIESPGLEQDVKVEDTDDVTLHDGMIFFSAPRFINNG